MGVKLSSRTLVIAMFFGGVTALVNGLMSTIPRDFVDRWRMLVDGNSFNEAEMTTQPETAFCDCHGIVVGKSAHRRHKCRRYSTKVVDQLPLRSKDIPSCMWQAVIASEDRRFFDHHGFDPIGISRAILSLSRNGGGSTITQQLIKNVFLTNERKWTRKLVEIILAFSLEKVISKWDILTLYLNKIYWGHGVYGLAGASALYFGKHPNFLTVGECAMLAGIIPAPEILSPYRDPSRGKRAQTRALRRMVEAGFLDHLSAVDVAKEPITLGNESSDGSLEPWKEPHHVNKERNSSHKKSKASPSWNDVWDYENASLCWEELEKMQEWIDRWVRRNHEMSVLRSQIQQLFHWHSDLLGH